MSNSEMRLYEDINKPGRKDANGTEWWACDPYPTWFRWVGDKLHCQETVAHVYEEPARPWPDGFNDHLQKTTVETLTEPPL